MGKAASKWLRLIRIMFIMAFFLIFCAAGVLTYYWHMPGSSYTGPMTPLSTEEEQTRDYLKGHVHMLATVIGERNAENYKELQSAVQYIKGYFKEAGMPLSVQTYDIEGRKFENIIVEVKGAVNPGEIIVVAAHYDTASNTPGANDNASGVAALLELARLLKERNPGRTLRLVAIVNEESPYFQTDKMGSRVYAKQAKERGENIVAMLALETIGYYSDKPGSQTYPPMLSYLYPDTGNYIAFIGNLKSHKLARRCVDSFRSKADFPSEGAALPGWMPGMDWSDHWAFWNEGYPAVMVTDTAPLRYPYYHTPEDTPDKLDYDRMTRVVSGLVQVITELVHVEK
jgi:Zn-dependent M28 family amino/carboxypeptidase